LLTPLIAIGLSFQCVVGLGHIGRGSLLFSGVAAGDRNIRIDFSALREGPRFSISALSVGTIRVGQLIVRSLQISGSVTLRVTALVRLLHYRVGLCQFGSGFDGVAFGGAPADTGAYQRPRYGQCNRSQ
jgi:hypothetical protein